VAAAESTASPTYTALTTPGPSVTAVVPASGKVLVSVAAAMIGNSSSTSCVMSYSIDGAPASDANAVILGEQDVQRASAISVLTGLTPGSHTFTAMYRDQGSGSLSCTFSNRAIAVLLLP
jgi:hypothetical protein